MRPVGPSEQVPAINASGVPEFGCQSYLTNKQTTVRSSTSEHASSHRRPSVKDNKSLATGIFVRTTSTADEPDVSQLPLRSREMFLQSLKHRNTFRLHKFLRIVVDRHCPLMLLSPRQVVLHSIKCYQSSRKCMIFFRKNLFHCLRRFKVR